MNYDRKEMISEDAETDFSSSDMHQQFLDDNRTEIRNLPDYIRMSPDILKHNVCRICATYHESGPKLVPLHTNDEGTKPLAALVNTFLPIKVNEEDGLPKFVCCTCASQLQAWHTMWENCANVQKMLQSQAESLLENHEAENEKLQFMETVQTVLTSYIANISSMELVCQACHSKTSSEEFHRHLSSSHGGLRSRDDIEQFVSEHVTFEETLDSDEDSSSVRSAEVALRSDRGLRRPGSTRSLLSQHLQRNGDGASNCETERGSEAGASDQRDLDRSEVHAGAAAARGACGQPAEERNQKRIPAVCPTCNRTFSNKYNMLTHMRSHAGEAAKFDCECGRSYSTRGNLAAHRRSAHLGRRPHGCRLCGRAFATRAARDRHAGRHGGAAPLRCPRCARACRDRAALARHTTTHTPRRLACQLCGKRFRRPAHLRYHVGTHRRRS